MVDIWPCNGYKAVKKETNCLLFIANEKDIRKLELASTLMEPYGSQHPNGSHIDGALWTLWISLNSVYYFTVLCNK